MLGLLALTIKRTREMQRETDIAVNYTAWQLWRHALQLFAS